MYKQIKTPNLDPVIYQGGKALTSWLGWCLAYVQTAFAAGWAGASAWQSWMSHTPVKHDNRNIPGGVYVPIWFDGYWSGHRYGHVAIYKDGKIWSSPLSNKPYADVFNSIEEVERRYGMKYVGWSEYVGSTRVIEKIHTASPEQVKALYLEILERPADAEGLKHYIKYTYDQVRNSLLGSAERQNLLRKKQEAQHRADEAKKEAERKARQAAEAENKKAQEVAQKAAEEAKRLAEAERQKKLEQAEQAASWRELAEEQRKTNSLLGWIVDLLKRVFNVK